VSIVLNLPPELESKLSADARQRGLSLADYVLQVLGADTLPQARPTSGADMVAFWSREGLIGTRSDIADSSVHARALRDKAQTRRRDEP
jgi:hypothetical protein